MLKKKGISILLSALILVSTLGISQPLVMANGVNGWDQNGTTWNYYINGNLKTGWQLDGGKWYYLNDDGSMALGWKAIGSTWYYLNPNGDMAIGWKQVGSNWYFLKANGSMAANTWIGNYYLGSDGAMLVNTATPDGYHVDVNGLWDGQPKTIDNKTDSNTILSAKDINNKYGNAVVYVEVQDENHSSIASGSGFIVNSNGIVVTNFHVIKGCSYASVTLQNGEKYDVKSVLNYNEKQDIAILKLSNATNLNTVKLGDSSIIEIGDNVVAIGSPKGYENTLSTGIISGVNRKNDRGNDIQTTASITHGSSGGALFDMYGNVIGITYAGYDSAGDLGFIIPINEVKPFLNNSNEKTLMEVNNIQHNNIAQPTGVTANAISSSEIQIQWNPVDGADYYYVYWSNSINGRYHAFSNNDGSKSHIPWKNGYSATLTSIDPNITVYFRVSAVKNGVESKASDVVSATTLGSVRFFPQLSDVPMPVNATYYTTSTFLLSDGSTAINYIYLGSLLPSNFISDYIVLLQNNGWIFNENGTTSDGSQYITYDKGNNLIMIGVVGNDLVITGSIH